MIRTRHYVSQSVQQLRPSGIRKYFDIAATMEDVITLGIGEPDFVTPRHIVEKSIESLRYGQTGYTNNSGTIELRRAIAAYIERLYGVSYDPDDQIIVTVGVSEAMWLALRAILDPGALEDARILCYQLVGHCSSQDRTQQAVALSHGDRARTVRSDQPTVPMANH